ncbi:UDP-glycosyltransferase 86A1-like [Olea europaea var. sylvestris]|uniref:UDP-glycosyltransferase 86A1-like n=1 Tax=Olea europaea var. sylvestris TaxID=158386 RepID=UPI000C1D3310|nr:UDP-glycosyltransferase 86A1-like [Olea europaea var. sylvestris]
MLLLLDDHKVTIDYIPGVKAIEPSNLMPYLQATRHMDSGAPGYLPSFRGCEKVRHHYLQHGFTKWTMSTSLWSGSDWTQWLNTKPNGSILYVSFGSHARKFRVIRPDIVSSNETKVLLTGFKERIKATGSIVQLCSQIKVISHSVVGGFSSHCGWNSVLESSQIKVISHSVVGGFLSHCGWNSVLENQFTNRKLVVNDWKIGINLSDKSSITREEVAKKNKCLMSGKNSEELRNAIKELRGRVGNALATKGSSHINFNLFIKD